MKHILDYIRKRKVLLLLIIPAFVFHMLVIMPSGSYLCHQGKCGIFFWGANGHDAVWHLALSAVSFRQYPFLFPTFSGALLTGYNYLLDLIVYLLSLIGISPLFSFFKLIPLVWFFAFTGLIIVLGRKIKDSVSFIFWLLFFAYFGSSFTFVFPLYHKGTIWGSSALVAMQSGQILTNLPFALSLIFILTILILIKNRKVTTKKTLLLGFLLFINLGLKFYGGIVSIFLVYGYYFFNFLPLKKLNNISRVISLAKNLLLLSVFVIIAVIFFYDPFNSFKSGSSLIFSPFATVHSIIEEPSLFYLKDMVNARYYLYERGIGPRLIAIEFFSLALVVFFGMGIRILGLFDAVFSIIKRKISGFDFLIFLTIVFSSSLTFLFIQKGQWWNTVQFFYYALFLANILTAEAINKAAKKKIIATILTVFIIAVSLPGNLDILNGFSSFSAAKYIPKEELEALGYLKKQPDGIVLSLPKDTKPNDLKPPLPLYLGEDSGYLTAFSSKQMYIGDEVQLQLTGIDYKGRLNEVMNPACEFMEKFKYVYLMNRQSKKISDCAEFNMDVIFKNSLVTIYTSHK